MWTALKKKEEDVAASGQRDSSVCKALSCKHKGLGSILRAHILKKKSPTVLVHTLYTEKLRGPRTLLVIGFCLQAEFKVQKTPLGY